MNGADGVSDIDGKAARGAASKCGQRASFNGATWMSDIEGRAARVAASEWSCRAARDIDGKTERSKWEGAHEVNAGDERVSMMRLNKPNCLSAVAR